MKSDKRVAAGKKSRRKGSGFERKIAKELQEWWGEGQFARTPSSGGWQNKSAREDFNACGDITTSADNWPWTCELKCQEGWSLDQLLLNDKPIVWSWWRQTLAETPNDKEPLLIFKKNRQKPMVMGLAVRKNVNNPSWGLLPEDTKMFETYDPEGERVVVFPLEALLNTSSEKWK